MGFKINAVKNISYVINYYTILETSEDASDIEIKKQYKTLASQYHPDKFQTAGEEIKSLSNKKMTLISEAYQILSHQESKQTYDILLSKFKKDKPNLISNDGHPILDLSSEMISLDYLLSDETEFETRKTQETKVEQLVGFNQVVFDMVESAYLNNPADESLKTAYLDQLTKKKISLDFAEMFAWQDVGVLNVGDVKYLTSEEYESKVEEKIELIKKEYDQSVKVRLLPGSEPLLLSGSSSDGDSLVKIKESIDNRLNKDSNQIMAIAKEKSLMLKKFVKVRSFKKLQDDPSLQIAVVLISKGICLSTFTLPFDEKGNPLDVRLDNSQNGVQESNISPLTGFNTYVLQFNPELEITFQVVEFLSDAANNSL